MLKYVTIAAVLFASAAHANGPTITGTVQSKCSIFTDTEGVYGNPTPYELDTASSAGGVMPVIRYDVASGDYYKARIAYPNSFSSSPSLNDTVAWTGAVEVQTVSDTLMSDYETNKVEYDNVVEFDMHTAGSVWYKVSSKATYGYNKSFPAGDYVAVVQAECIAK